MLCVVSLAVIFVWHGGGASKLGRGQACGFGTGWADAGTRWERGRGPNLTIGDTKRHGEVSL